MGPKVAVPELQYSAGSARVIFLETERSGQLQIKNKCCLCTSHLWMIFLDIISRCNWKMLILWALGLLSSRFRRQVLPQPSSRPFPVLPCAHLTFWQALQEQVLVLTLKEVGKEGRPDMAGTRSRKPRTSHLPYTDTLYSSLKTFFRVNQNLKVISAMTLQKVISLLALWVIPSLSLQGLQVRWQGHPRCPQQPRLWGSRNRHHFLLGPLHLF